MQVRALRGLERQRARSGSIAATANHATKAIGRVKRSIDTFSRSGDVTRFSVEDTIGAIREIPESGTEKLVRTSALTPRHGNWKGLSVARDEGKARTTPMYGPQGAIRLGHSPGHLSGASAPTYESGALAAR